MVTGSSTATGNSAGLEGLNSGTSDLTIATASAALPASQTTCSRCRVSVNSHRAAVRGEATLTRGMLVASICSP